jgi:hypothetical protein
MMLQPRCFADLLTTATSGRKSEANENAAISAIDDVANTLHLLSAFKSGCSVSIR